MAAKRAERLVNLVIALLSTRQYVTAARIRATVPGYEADDGSERADEAFKRMFERDKAELREMGVPLETGRTSVFDTEDGYRIARADYELPEIRLTGEEAAAVGLALRLWESAHMAGAAHSALVKLKAAGIDVDSSRAIPLQPRLDAGEPAFEPCYAAARDRRQLEFGYQRPDEDTPARRRGAAGRRARPSRDGDRPTPARHAPRTRRRRRRPAPAAHHRARAVGRRAGVLRRRRPRRGTGRHAPGRHRPPHPARRHGSARMTASGTTDRMTRLLALVPYLTAREDGVAVSEVARDFGVTERQLRGDLELLWMCGLPGYGPGDLIDLSFEGDRVRVTFTAGMVRPLRLTTDEAVAPGVALRTLLDLPGLAEREAVSRALAKVSAAAGHAGERVTPVAVSVDAHEEALAVVREGLERKHALHLHYYVPTRDERT